MRGVVNVLKKGIFSEQLEIFIIDNNFFDKYLRHITIIHNEAMDSCSHVRQCSSVLF